MVAKKGSAKKTTATKKKTTATKVASSKVKSAVKKVKANEKAVVKKTEVKQKVVVKTAEHNKTENKKVKKVISKSDNVVRATGKRKTSVAKVACFIKNGEKITISVNDLDYKKYFTKLLNQDKVYAPFALLGINTGYVVEAEVFGGGKSGQADALKLGLSKCLSIVSEEFNKMLRKHSFLTRDSRRVEPKKYGLKKARKKEQFSKR